MINIKFKSTYFLIPLLTQCLAFAAPSNLSVQRFQPWIVKLENIFNSLNSISENETEKFNKKLERIIEEIPSTEARVAAFNLQSLGELYSSQDKDFKSEIKNFAKRLEDTIGRLDYLNTVYKSTSSKKDLENLRIGKENLKNLLLEDRWVVKPDSKKEPRTKAMQKFLKEYSWPEENEETQSLLTEVYHQLDRIRLTSFDLTRLEKNRNGEDGNGLHELRRQIRWFLISARVLEGLISFKANPEVCYINKYNNLYKTDLATSKYSQLISNPKVKNSCQIEQCQFLAMSDAANKLGEWKDSAEKDSKSRATDSLPQQFVEPAEGLYAELQGTGLIQKLQDDISTCIQKNDPNLE